MDDHINDLRMPTDEVKRIKERIARLLGDVNAAEAKILNEGGSMAREVMPLVLQLRALRAQLKNLELGETNQPTDPGPGSGSTKVSTVSRHPDCRVAGLAEKPKG